MKFFAVLFLTAMVAITIENCKARFLLVEIDSQSGTGKFYLFCYILNEDRYETLNFAHE